MLRPWTLPRRRPRDPGLVLVLAAATVLGLGYAVWAWQRHRWYLTAGYDLGIFDQATSNLADLRAPASSLREVPNLWGDHFHPIIVLWGALRVLWDSPVALLVSQAGLVAAATVPLYLFGRDRIGRTAGTLVALAYGTSWGVQRAIDFDVHELAFAPLLLACAVLFADRGQWRRFWVAALLLLCVKEDVALVVVALGVWLVLEGHRRHGLAAVAAGGAWAVLATRWWIPELGVQEFTYWSYYRFGSDVPEAVVAAVTHPWRLVTVAVDDAVKVGTMLALVAPFLVLTPWLTRLAVLPVPLFAERFLSDQEVYWGTTFHYSLLPTMALAIASVGGIATVRRLLDRRAARAGDRPARARWATAGRWTPAVLAGAGLLAGTAAWFPVYGATGSDEPPLAALATLGTPPRNVDRHALDRVVAAVPATGSIAAPRTMQPHLTGRDQPVHLLESRDVGRTPHVTTDDNVVVDLVDPAPDAVALPERTGEVVDAVDVRLARGGLVSVWASADGWVVLRSTSAPGGARRDPALGALGPAEDAALRRAANRWATVLRTTRERCLVSCEPAASADLDAAAAAAGAASRTAAATSAGTCGPILRGVADAPAELLRRRAAIAATPGSGPAQARFQAAVQGRLAGALRRALMVCGADPRAPGRGLPAPPTAPGVAG